MAKKPFRKLSVKLALVLILAAMAASVIGVLVNLGGNLLVQQVYDSDGRRAQREQAAITAFRDYVREMGLGSTDAEKINLWNQRNPYVQLTVQANGTTISSDQWGTELMMAANGLILNLRNDGSSYGEYPVNFRDGAFTVQIREFSVNRLYNVVRIAAMATAGMCFLLMMLLYNSRITAAITRLARQVRQVSQGDLTLEIAPPSRDEIGGLAEDVDAMRLSILDKLHREEAAWQANTELITAISHDVRTPLTTLMGYLEVLQQRSDLTEAQKEEYLRLCGAKAEKLKVLTDELFSYFLVFGKPEPDSEMEVFQADMLLEQLLGEAAAELMAEDYQVELRGMPEEGEIRVDVQHLRRVLDNLFSNIRKYADPKEPVVLWAGWQEGKLHVSVSNTIRTGTDRPESTKIGLQTCEKLMTAMGGAFRRVQKDGIFTAELVLPGV